MSSHSSIAERSRAASAGGAGRALQLQRLRQGGAVAGGAGLGLGLLRVPLGRCAVPGPQLDLGRGAQRGRALKAARPGHAVSGRLAGRGEIVLGEDPRQPAQRGHQSVDVVALFGERPGPLERAAGPHHVSPLAVELAVEDLGNRGVEGPKSLADGRSVVDGRASVVELTETQVGLGLVGQSEGGEEPVAGPGLQRQVRLRDGPGVGAAFQGAGTQVGVDPGQLDAVPAIARGCQRKAVLLLVTLPLAPAGRRQGERDMRRGQGARIAARSRLVQRGAGEVLGASACPWLHRVVLSHAETMASSAPSRAGSWAAASVAAAAPDRPRR